MRWNLDKKRPICPQIVEQFCILIASGELQPGDRLASVREVALAAGVTPNTVQKSFEQLEEKGAIYSIRGSGWYVGDNNGVARKVLDHLVHNKTKSYLNDMQAIGLDVDQIIDLIKEEYRYE